jgi:hypothetical protein
VKPLPPIRPLMQPTDDTCGQTCVAMIVGVTVDEVVQAMGWNTATSWQDCRRALAKFGIKTGGGDRPFPTVWRRGPREHKLPPYSIVEVRDAPRPKTWGHVVVLRDGIVYDPLYGCGIPILGYARGHLSQTDTQFWVHLPILGRA